MKSFDQMNSKLFEQNTRKKFPSPRFCLHALIPRSQSTLSSPRYSPHSPIPMHQSPSYKIDILPSQCYRYNIYKSIRFYLLFLLMSSSPRSYPTLSPPRYRPHATITTILSPGTHPNIPNPTLPMSPTEKSIWKHIMRNETMWSKTKRLKLSENRVPEINYPLPILDKQDHVINKKMRNRLKTEYQK